LSTIYDDYIEMLIAKNPYVIEYQTFEDGENPAYNDANL
jgi:hypothetical protein